MSQRKLQREVRGSHSLNENLFPKGKPTKLQDMRIGAVGWGVHRVLRDCLAEINY